MDIKDELQKAFSESGLSISEASYGEVWQRIYESGAHYRKEFERVAGKRTWERVMRSGDIKISEQDHIRILGFGAAITGYMIASLNLSEAERAIVVRLGTLANFIVTFFDHCLDAGDKKAILLPDPSKLIGHRASALAFFFRALVNPRVRFINRLVRHYLQSLNRLPFARRRPEIIKLVHRAIKIMYRAELQTAARSEISLRTIRRKGGLPFVVMALPAWLSVGKIDEAEFISHLRRSYRFGYFFCLLDDAVDLSDDKRHNRPNYFLLDSNRSKSPETIAARVADYGTRVKNDWRRRTIDKTPIGLTFHALIRSWIGKT